MQGGWQPGGGGYGTGGYGPPGAPGAPGAPPPGYGGAPMAPVPPQGFAEGYGSYEFNELENAILTRTAARAKLWGVISVVLGVTQMVGSCGMLASSSLGLLLPIGIVALIVGMTFIGVGNSLDSAARTQGRDMPHLMAAMQKLTTAFTVQIVCNVIGVVLFAVMMIFLFFAAIVSAASQP